ncbi:hypothetical protein [Roseovarius rhodophyticola]|uniref:Uncharacterized protein n=1 Tax=Roseovarius rhodophyticola TaxID=3080827 RepID=A0ABZ2TB75_9RHOB|nr:hypothetical protein [Roseovarius sp. W115]MDV2930664.1 hypothetical protein [Roseovarius sp. W115]
MENNGYAELIQKIETKIRKLEQENELVVCSDTPRRIAIEIASAVNQSPYLDDGAIMHGEIEKWPTKAELAKNVQIRWIPHL